MRELSLHILDIVQNSIEAQATLIEIVMKEDISNDLLKITIVDNGTGISKEKLWNITDPFVTTRKTRRVGLGLSLFEVAAMRCEGSLKIRSNPKGTEVISTFRHSHIDRAPIGNIADTLVAMAISLKKDTNLVYKHSYNHNVFTLDTREVRRIIGDKIPLNHVRVLNWIKNTVNEELSKLVEVQNEKNIGRT